MFVLPLIFAAAAATTTVSQTFLDRIAFNGNPWIHHTVTAGALPPGWTPPAPLPQSITLLGSVFTPHYVTDLYYDTPHAQNALAAYVAQLQAAGFHRQYQMGQSGFVAAPSSGGFSNATIMCRNAQSVAILVPAVDDLRVSFPAVGMRDVPNACSLQEPRMTTPLPNLVAPPGTTMVPASGGGASWGMGRRSSAYSSAAIETRLSPKALLSAFSSQMRAAHWRAESPFTLPQAASQSFSYDNGTLHWKASIVIMPATGPHAYVARLAADGTPIFNSAPVVSPERPAATKLAASDAPAALRLVQQIEREFSPEGAAIYPHALPPNFNRALPMPAATLVGSLASSDGVSVYYEATKTQFDAYVAQLRKAGWAPMPTEPQHIGGFALGAFGNISTFCKRGEPLIYTRVAGPYSNDLDVRIVQSPESQTCSPAAFSGMRGAHITPLPALSTPQNATMKPGSAGIMGGLNGATIVSSRPLGDLLADFAKQLSTANWTAGTPVVSDALGSQSFSYTDTSGARWQGVLTIYRSQNDPKTYYAFVDVTPL